MIRIHHLGVSQSDRVVWLMEELELPYELVWYDRAADGLAPPEYRALHPAGTAPIIEDGKTVLCESAAILEYITWRHAEGRLSVDRDQPNYPDYLFWMTFSNSLQSMFFIRLIERQVPEEARVGTQNFVDRRENAYYQCMESRLGEAEYLAGPEFTAADIMMTFNVTSLANFGGRTIDDLENTRAYVERITARPAYQKAMRIAGPQATRPS